MGKIMAGILSKVSGKVAGVVGASWKDRAYLRAYVIPSNPKSLGQVAQRTAFSACVEFAIPLVGQVFNKYTDMFQKSMSGYNFFIKKNIVKFAGGVLDVGVKITEGKLFFDAPTFPTYDASSGHLSVPWSTALGNNGLATDKVFAVAYDGGTKLFYFASAEVARSVGTMVMNLPHSLVANHILTWTFAIQYKTGVIQMISDSVYREATTPG